MTPRALHVLPVAERGGAEQVVLDLVRHARDWDNAAVLPAEGALADDLRAAGAEVRVLPTGRFRDPAGTARHWRRLARTIRDLDADLVHGCAELGHLRGTPAARLARVPAVWTQHNAPRDAGPLVRAACLLPADAILCNSRHTARLQARAMGGRCRGRVRPVPLGTDAVRFRPPDADTAADDARVRGELTGGDDGPPLVVLPARLQRWKGPDVFLRAFAVLHRRGRDVRGAVVGGARFGLERSWGEDLRRWAAEAGLLGRLVFAGWREDMPECLRAADVVVHASRVPEPFGLTVIEAMACGRPVVAADAGGPRETVVTPGEADRRGTDATGLRTHPGDARDLADAIETLVDDADLRRRMGAAGRRRVLEHYTVGHMVERFESACTQVLNRARATRGPFSG